MFMAADDRGTGFPSMLAVGVGLVLWVWTPVAFAQSKGFSLAKQEGRLDISLDGQKIAEYVHRHEQVKRPFFAHLKTPGGIQVTRNFPPIEGKDSTDHATMHPGLWIAFAKLNGITFWHNAQGRIVHKGFTTEPSGGESAQFGVASDYVAPGGEVIGHQQTSYRFVKDPAGYLILVDARFTSEKGLTFGVKEEMGLGVRVASAIRVKGGNGTIVNSAGGRDEKGTWGKVARWWDYSGKIEGRAVGIMVMSAPDNPEVWSHSRDYGLLVANPFPVDIKENRDKTKVIAPGKEFRLRFGVLVHEHTGRQPFKPEAAYERYNKALK